MGPIRMDKIGEAEYRTANKSMPQRDPLQTSFLWTLGSRPFWELWPNKRLKKKRMNLEEFIQCLMLRWAQSHDFPAEIAASATSSVLKQKSDLSFTKNELNAITSS